MRSHAKTWPAAWALAVVLMAGLAAWTLSLGGCCVLRGPATTASSGRGHPTSPRDLVLSSITAGGLVGPDAQFSVLPEYSLYGDGRLITQGPIIAIYPPPLLPNLISAPVTEAGIQQILAAADEAGLLRTDVDYGTPSVTDMPVTTFTVVAGGQTYVTRVYALGFQGPGGSGLTTGQEQARQRVMGFQAKLGDISGFLGQEVGHEEPYAFIALAVLASPITKVEPDSSGLQPGIADWPLESLETLGTPGPRGREATIAGQDLQTLLPALQEANMLTVWRSNGALFHVAVRPLLPHELGAK